VRARTCFRACSTLQGAYTSNADIWVLNQGDPLAVQQLSRSTVRHSIAQIPGVASVGTFQSEFMNVGDRRVWMIARTAVRTKQLLKSQMVDGNPAGRQSSVCREGGWITVSQQLAPNSMWESEAG